MDSVFHFIQAGGLVMYPLILLSFAAVLIIVERLIAFRQLGGTSPGLTDRTVKMVREGKLDEATSNAAAKSGPVATSILTILQNRNLPEPEVEGLVEEAGQPYFQRLERFLPVLDTTTTISPLLGLLGTIIGMIGTFNAIAAQKAHGNSDAVMSGVGEALYATATGLCIAVICFIAYNYFASRLRTIISETEQAATRVLNAIAGHNASIPIKERIKDAV
ncbi:MAG TPA: MotA/TolQ/ExbB proton channel family protein [Fimbriimonadaceae bacterium]|jgi:biopolymer transport protein ExbB